MFAKTVSWKNLNTSDGQTPLFKYVSLGAGLDHIVAGQSIFVIDTPSYISDSGTYLWCIYDNIGLLGAYMT